jgi:DNA-binding transcriptional MerR regulator
VAQVTAKDILLVVIIPLALAELGPWCGWLAARVLPLAARLRYGDRERAAVRLEEWSGDLDDIPGQLTKLAYAFGQLAAGSVVSARRKTARGMSAADDPRGAQGVFFEADEALGVSRTADVGAGDIGYRAPTACAAAGISYSQLDHWARMGLVEPSVRAAHGSGSQRLYSFRDILVLKVVKWLLDTGASLQQIRAGVQHLRLRDRGIEDLAQVTLMGDGVSVYECTSADEVVDLLHGGVGAFGIALGRVWREVEGDLAVLPAVRTETG